MVSEVSCSVINYNSCSLLELLWYGKKVSHDDKLIIFLSGRYADLNFSCKKSNSDFLISPIESNICV